MANIFAKFFPIAALGGLAYGAYRWQQNWGANQEDVESPLPGDDLVENAKLVNTRAIDIAAPAEAVWPWLVQIGQDRGGFYSYEVVENLMGLDIQNTDAINPEWQDLKVGDPVKLAEGMALEAKIVDAPEALVLYGSGQDPEAPVDFDFTWQFILQRVDDASCRLIERERYGWATTKGALQVLPVNPFTFVMTHKMLKGIKERAEANVTAV
ncbi:MAG: hypothetical protein LBR20_00985 [Propionibacteriaceae bacterium]|jgi:hypothetical protein|nr:hypothetical protein [Propionibacteriaceae bacterium]